ncbi:MAG TPA: hypothetical protein VLG76_00905 [Rhabdochlamydiaceae bacterium]|nr:hypothetical protein [Rhabdochlamydiaceae bacterium]
MSILETLYRSNHPSAAAPNVSMHSEAENRVVPDPKVGAVSRKSYFTPPKVIISVAEKYEVCCLCLLNFSKLIERCQNEIETVYAQKRARGEKVTLRDLISAINTIYFNDDTDLEIDLELVNETVFATECFKRIIRRCEPIQGDEYPAFNNLLLKLQSSS